MLWQNCSYIDIVKYIFTNYIYMLYKNEIKYEAYGFTT